MRIPVWANDAGLSRLGLMVVPFFDYGNGKDNAIGLPGLDDPSSEELMSVGAGLTWNWWQPFYAEIFYGAELKDVNNTGDSLQDKGIQFLTSFQWSF